VKGPLDGCKKVERDRATEKREATGNLRELISLCQESAWDVTFDGGSAKVSDRGSKTKKGLHRKREVGKKLLILDSRPSEKEKGRSVLGQGSGESRGEVEYSSVGNHKNEEKYITRRRHKKNTPKKKKTRSFQTTPAFTK